MLDDPFTRQARAAPLSCGVFATRSPDPTPSDIETLTHKIAHRLTAVVERLCADECETEAVLARTAASLREALATAVAPPIPKLGLELCGLDHTATGTPLCAKVAGFSLHAARVIPAHDRNGLEKLCRYGLRAPLSQERLSLRADGCVVYHLRRPWPNAQGATSLVLVTTTLGIMTTQRGFQPACTPCTQWSAIIVHPESVPIDAATWGLVKQIYR